MAFGTVGALFVLGVLVIPALVHGAGGIAALPTVPRAVAAPQVAPTAPAPTTPRMFNFPSLSKTHIAFAFAGEIWVVAREGGDARRLVAGQLRNETPDLLARRHA